MAVCRGCGAQINPQERFCGYCGTDQFAASSQQAGYDMAPAHAAAGGGMARAAMGLGIAGGLLGVIWGVLAPYLSWKWPEHIQWYLGTVSPDTPYPTGIRYEIVLIIGLVVSLLGIVGGIVAPKARGVAAVILVVCGLVGFILGGSWLIPGALLLAAFGLALAATRA
jgi:hypothetical protein